MSSAPDPERQPEGNRKQPATRKFRPSRRATWKELEKARRKLRKEEGTTEP